MGKLKTRNIKTLSLALSHKKLITIRVTLLKILPEEEFLGLQDWKQDTQCWKFTKAKLTLKPSPECSTYKVKKTPAHFLLNCKEYDTEQAKLEKDIKKIYKNNSHKLNITIGSFRRVWSSISRWYHSKEKSGRVYSGNRKRNLKGKK